MMTILYLVRHGEAGDERVSKVSYSPKNEYDKPLTTPGLAQAKKLNAVFRSLTFNRTYTSDYLRAIETFEQLDLSSESHWVLPEIRELYCECIGRNFGNTDLAEFSNQKTRVQSFIDNHLNTLKAHETVLVVAHGCLILYLLQKLLGKSFGHDMTYTSVTKLTFNGEWDFSYFNDSSHLYEPVAADIQNVINN